jgi:hypothetical protein
MGVRSGSAEFEIEERKREVMAPEEGPGTAVRYPGGAEELRRFKDRTNPLETSRGGSSSWKAGHKAGELPDIRTSAGH